MSAKPSNSSSEARATSDRLVSIHSRSTCLPLTLPPCWELGKQEMIASRGIASPFDAKRLVMPKARREVAFPHNESEYSNVCANGPFPVCFVRLANSLGNDMYVEIPICVFS